MFKPQAAVLSLLMALGCASWAGSDAPDRVELKDGSVLFGTVGDADDGK